MHPLPNSDGCGRTRSKCGPAQMKQIRVLIFFFYFLTYTREPTFNHLTQKKLLLCDTRVQIPELPKDL